MKNLIFPLVLVLVSASAAGQNALSQPTVNAHQLYVHYYPSDLIAGDITFGLEHVYKKKLSHEFSFGIRSFPGMVNYYNKGFRADYLLKYNLYAGKIFRFSPNLSFTYKDVSYSNRVAGYNYMDPSGTIRSEPYRTHLEDGQLKEFGIGLGVSLNFKIARKLYAGADITYNNLRYEHTTNTKDRVEGEIQQVPYSAKSESGMHIERYIRLKLSYALFR